MIRYDISEELDLCYVACHGAVTSAQFRDAYHQYRADPRYVPGRHELVDCSQTTDVDLDFNSVRALVRMANRQPEGVKVETLVVMLAYSPWSFGVMRMFESVTQVVPGVQVRACRNDDEVCAALHLSGRDLAHLRGEKGRPGLLNALREAVGT